MTTERYDHSVSRPTERAGVRPVTRAFIGGIVLGLVVGGAIGFFAASGGASFHSKWADNQGAFVHLPEQTPTGALPQTVTLSAGSYDFGGVGEALSPQTIDAGSIVRVELQAQSGRVGVSLARPDGGELVSREAVVTPAQGKTTLYFHTAPGMGPVDVLLRSADPATATARIDKVQAAAQADIGRGEMNKINQAGVN